MKKNNQAGKDIITKENQGKVREELKKIFASVRPNPLFDGPTEALKNRLDSSRLAAPKIGKPSIWQRVKDFFYSVFIFVTNTLTLALIVGFFFSVLGVIWSENKLVPTQFALSCFVLFFALAIVVAIFERDDNSYYGS